MLNSSADTTISSAPYACLLSAALLLRVPAKMSSADRSTRPIITIVTAAR
jgi:hypothetical protein